MTRRISEDDERCSDEERIPELPKDLVKYVEKPYGGLLGNSAQVRIVEEIVADPYMRYRPRDLEELVDASAPTVRRALNTLTDLGLLIKDENDKQHPVYCANFKSKKLLALTFLAFSINDDNTGSNCLDDAILDYYSRVIGPGISFEISTGAPLDPISSRTNWITKDDQEPSLDMVTVEA